MSRRTRLLARAAATLFLAAVVAPDEARGQQPSSIVLLDREMRERAEREREEDFARRLNEELLRRPVGHRPEPRLALAQIREDYVRIQVITNELARAARAGGPLDLKLVAASAGEVRKRAGRLKTNLPLPEPSGDDKRPKPSVDTAQLKMTLGALDLLILRFVRNPVFTNPKLVDLRHSAAARRDLDDIIELSGQLKKSCEGLLKTAQKSQ